MGTHGCGSVLGLVLSQVTLWLLPSMNSPRQPLLVHMDVLLQPCTGIAREEQQPKLTLSVHADLLSCFCSTTPPPLVPHRSGCGAGGAWASHSCLLVSKVQLCASKSGPWALAQSPHCRALRAGSPSDLRHPSACICSRHAVTFSSPPLIGTSHACCRPATATALTTGVLCSSSSSNNNNSGATIVAAAAAAATVGY